MFPEAGGSSSFARRAFNEFWSFFAAWGQMLNYMLTVAIVGVLRAPLHRRPVLVGAGTSTRRRHCRDCRDRRPGGDQHPRGQGIDRDQPGPGGDRLLHAGADRARGTGAGVLAPDAGRQRNPGRRADLGQLLRRDPAVHARLHGDRDDLEHVRGGQESGQDGSPGDKPRGYRSVHDLRAAAGDRPVGAAGATRGQPLRHPAGRRRAAGRLRRRPGAGGGARPAPGTAPARRRDLRRSAGGDDPVHRHQRRHPRRVAADLLDGHPPPGPRPPAPAAPSLRDAVGRDSSCSARSRR